MGRTRVTSGGELVAAALRVVARDGAAAVSSRTVAVEAGVALGTVYRHVRDLDALLAAAAAEVEAAFVADLRRAAPDDRPLRPAVPAVAAAVVARARAEPRLAELMARPGPDGEGIRGWISRRVRRAVADGELDAPDPDLVAAAGYGLARGVLQHGLAAERAADVLAAGLAGLLAAPPGDSADAVRR